MLLLALLAAEGFRVVQYAPKPVALRGCAECQGEADDVCEVRAGVQAQPIDEYLKQRWPAPGRLKLIRSKAESDCAVQVKGVLGPHAQLELAMLRMDTAPPALTLLESLGPPVDGWPRGLQRRTAAAASSSRKPDRAALRQAVLCWPSERGWPSAAGSDARPLDASNRCEAWLLAVKPDTGEPDLGGISFPIRRPSFAYAPSLGAAAEARLTATTTATATATPAATTTATAREPAPAAPEPRPKVPQESGPPAHPVPQNECGDAARARAATLDRFDQWDLQIRSATRASLDRGSWTLDAAAWSGHCQELDVLRTSLEQQLACAVAVFGHCASLEAR
jgi:hypothetical protein